MAPIPFIVPFAVVGMVAVKGNAELGYSLGLPFKVGFEALGAIEEVDPWDTKGSGVYTGEGDSVEGEAADERGGTLGGGDRLLYAVDGEVCILPAQIQGHQHGRQSKSIFSSVGERGRMS